MNEKILYDFSNVVWIGKEIEVKWQSYEMVEAELRLLQEAHKQGYDYYHLISGQCLCLRTAEEFDDIICKYDGRSFVEKRFEMTDRETIRQIYVRFSMVVTIKTNSILDFLNIGTRCKELDREYTKPIIAKDEMFFRHSFITMCPNYWSMTT